MSGISEIVDIENVVSGLPSIGPRPTGQWIGVGFAKREIAARLNLSDEDACWLIDEYLGRLVPFKFQAWSMIITKETYPPTTQPLVAFADRDGAPDLPLSVFRGVLFPDGAACLTAWSKGVFGRRFARAWVIARNGINLRVHSFELQGMLLDAVALQNAIGSPEPLPSLTTVPDNAPPPPVTSQVHNLPVRKPGRPNLKNEAIAIRDERLQQGQTLSDFNLEANEVHRILLARHSDDLNYRYALTSLKKALREAVDR